MRKNPSLAGRAFLAVVLMIGFYALALGLCAALGLLAWFDLQGRHIHPKLLLFAVFTIGVVVWSIWPRREKFPDPGVRLREDDQPELWRMVREVADAAEQAPPRALFLVEDVNAFVAERNSIMGFGGERIMGLGLPLLQVLTVPQLRSVIAHEFGHFHGGDTRLGPFIYRTRAAIGRTIVNFHKAESLLHKPFEWYGNLFLRATFSISRAQEFAADALSVQLVGLAPMQTALRRVNEVGPLYDHYLEGEFLPILNRKMRPPLAAGFELFLASQAIAKVQVEFGEHAMQAKGDPYDSHPPLPQRLAAAAEVENPGRATPEGPRGITLLRDVEAVEGALLAFLTGHREVAKLPTGTWQDLQGPSLLASWAEFAAKEGAKLPPLRVAELAAQAGQLDRHARAVNPKIPAEERRGAGGWMLGLMLGHALHRAGWQLQTAPGDPVLMVRGDAHIEPFAVGRELAAGKLGEDVWQQTCAEHGIGELPLSGPEVTAPPAG